MTILEILKKPQLISNISKDGWLEITAAFLLVVFQITITIILLNAIFRKMPKSRTFAKIISPIISIIIVVTYTPILIPSSFDNSPSNPHTNIERIAPYSTNDTMPYQTKMQTKIIDNTISMELTYSININNMHESITYIATGGSFKITKPNPKMETFLKDTEKLTKY